jgi:hypothetical protein
MSALPPEADIRQRVEHVCFVPIADVSSDHQPRSGARRSRSKSSNSKCDEDSIIENKKAVVRLWHLEDIDFDDEHVRFWVLSGRP